MNEEQIKKSEQEREARALVRRVFSTPDGIKVLTALLLDLGFFSQATDPESVARRNFAVFYLRERLGFTQAQDAASVVELMLKLGK